MDFKISIYGECFDIDAFIKSTDLSLKNMYKKGDSINDKKNYKHSGVDIQIINEDEAINEIGSYIQAFIEGNSNIFLELKKKYKADRIVLIAHFYINTAEELAISFGFSSDFHAMLAKYDIDTDFTIWDNSGLKKED